jgi:hypothetical protein
MHADFGRMPAMQAGMGRERTLVLQESRRLQHGISSRRPLMQVSLWNGDFC